MSWFKNLFNFESQLEDAPEEEFDEQEECCVEFHVLVSKQEGWEESYYFTASYYYFDDGFVHFVDCGRETVGSVHAQRVILIERIEEHEAADPEDMIDAPLPKTEDLKVVR